MQPRPKRLDGRTYWRLKAGVLESALDEANAQQLVERAQWRRRLALAEAGLDQAKLYKLDDATETVTADEIPKASGSAQ